jgi:hypothetical protein
MVIPSPACRSPFLGYAPAALALEMTATPNEDIQW